MVKKLTKHGNSLALVLDRGVLDLLEIDADTPLNIKTDGKCLIVTPAQTPRGRRSSRRHWRKVNQQYGPDAKKAGGVDDEVRNFYPSTRSWTFIATRSNDTVARLGSVMSRFWSPLCGRLNPGLAISIFMATSSRWHQPISFTSYRTIRFIDGNKRTGADGGIRIPEAKWLHNCSRRIGFSNTRFTGRPRPRWERRHRRFLSRKYQVITLQCHLRAAPVVRCAGLDRTGLVLPYFCRWTGWHDKNACVASLLLNREITRSERGGFCLPPAQGK